VKGDSMTERCNADGEYVMYTPTAAPIDGDYGAVPNGQHSTIKTLSHSGSTVVLEAANPAERAIEVSPRDDFAILGVVCGVFRPFFEQEPAKEAEEIQLAGQLH
jgi:SOS-response transcriptional repressor LexA